jgi:hypothetical protein
MRDIASKPKAAGQAVRDAALPERNAQGVPRAPEPKKVLVGIAEKEAGADDPRE